MDSVSSLLREEVVCEKALVKLRNDRKKFYNHISVSINELDVYLNDNWQIERKFKNKVRLKKIKRESLMFEDKVWTLFANLGFSYLNKDKNFIFPTINQEESKQSFEVFCADSEIALFIKCLVHEGATKESSFEEIICNIGGEKSLINSSVKKLFNNSKHKVKFIIATKNLYLSEEDKKLLKNYDILHFDEDSIDYYQELHKHLGFSAKFQLLGNLFEGQTIPELENRIPAITGKMGGHTYYSFSIEPEKLLKISYVLHRNKANKKFMPTYQRLIKKERIRSIQKFINDGGFFPNSVIININTNGKKIKFDYSSAKLEDAISKVGILHFPKRYRAAYVIDGQHRLYGYADSNYFDSNSIPVIAFVDLSRKEQLSLFMQINENQKTVPKNLRNTLNSDLLWNSESYLEQITALKLQIAQDLGEELSSPLYNRIIIGENPKTQFRNITIEAIKIGLDRSNFLGKFLKNEIKEVGTFFRGDNDATYDVLMPFIMQCFAFIKDKLNHEWNKNEHDGFIVINAGIESLIRIFSDIADHLVADKKIFLKEAYVGDIIGMAKPYLDTLVDFLKSLSEEQKLELRKSYGAGGRVRYWRILQRAINDKNEDFKPNGLTKYWLDEAKTYNEESFKIIRDIETHMKNDFYSKLYSYYKDDWMKIGIPRQLCLDIHNLAVKKNLEQETGSPEVKPWDCLNIIDYRKIATYKKNWSDIFEQHYTKPGEEKIRGGKDAKTDWMQKLEKIRNENFHSYSVKQEEYLFLKELQKWFSDK